MSEETLARIPVLSGHPPRLAGQIQGGRDSPASGRSQEQGCAGVGGRGGEDGGTVAKSLPWEQPFCRISIRQGLPGSCE